MQALVDEISAYLAAKCPFFNIDANRLQRQGGLKLHVTLMNSRYRDEKEDENGRAQRYPFDATNIMKVRHEKTLFFA